MDLLRYSVLVVLLLAGILVEGQTDDDPPTIDGEEFLTVEEDSNASVIWTAYDSDPDVYLIYMDENLLVSGIWSSGQPITMHIVTSDVQTFLFTVRVADKVGNTANTSTRVNIVDTLSPELLTLEHDLESVSITIKEKHPYYYHFIINDILWSEDSWAPRVEFPPEITTVRLIFPINGMVLGNNLIQLNFYDMSDNLLEIEFYVDTSITSPLVSSTQTSETIFSQQIIGSETNSTQNNTTSLRSIHYNGMFLFSFVIIFVKKMKFNLD
ncbi:MAG: hypothetical protein IH840_10210 [Candidatus Heimdallarchaeota archaeon]|nr:hypothetical protein [Candidatus Heimdallarchaeota archaeon]